MRVIDSRHYEIHTDLDDALANDLARRMDAMYDEYATRLASFGAPDESELLQADIFRNLSDYVHLVGLTGKATAGMFIPAKEVLAAHLEGEGRDELRHVLQHEAFHQFAYHAISKHLPVWLSEGLAQVFQEAIWTGRSFQLGEAPPYRVRQLKADMSGQGLMDFAEILNIQPQQWASHWDHGSVAQLEYNQAWAMTHFLIYSTGPDGRPRFRARMLAMLRDLHDGMDADEAFRTDFSGNLAGFHDRFVEWAQGLTATPLAQAIEDQQTLADLEVGLSSKGQTFNSLAAFQAACVNHRWQMHYRMGNLTWTSDPDPTVYFNAQDLHLESSDTALPDLVCSPQAGLRLRTHFFSGQRGIEHETLVETDQ